MKITFLRHCTMTVEYGNIKFLIDPVFGAKGSKEPLKGKADTPMLRNPLTDLPLSPDEIVSGMSAMILSHNHPDHIDKEAADKIPKNIPIFVQNLQDKDTMRNFGFKKTFTVNMTPWTKYQDIQVIKAPGKHGDASMTRVLNEMNNSGGFVLKKAGEKTIYFAGDTIWYMGVEDTLTRHRPDLIVANVGGAYLNDMRLIMDLPDLKAMHEFLPSATIIAVHLEAFNNCPITRQDVYSFASANGFADKVIIPADGDVMVF
ncbi:MAG: MBL fold metallo-hydrolase [Blautia sp.]|nr:MBL fold metallo-hydrolase [Blautia sp.]